MSNWSIGDVVWHKMDGSPFWPSMVSTTIFSYIHLSLEQIADPKLIPKKVADVKIKGYVCVQFFPLAKNE